MIISDDYKCCHSTNQIIQYSLCVQNTDTGNRNICNWSNYKQPITDELEIPKRDICAAAPHGLSLHE